MYWDIVLKEVLNKENPAQECPFTNVKAYKEQALSGMIQEVRINPCGFKKRFKKYPLGENYPGIYFTEREAQTVFYFLYGRTTVEVATILGLSRRTIEFYVKNMKAKLNCRLKSELIYKVRSSEFLEFANFHV